MDGGFFWTCAIVAAVAVGMGKGGLPVVAMLSVPVLSLAVSPVTAAGLLLPVYVLSDAFGLYAYRHSIDRRVFAILMVGVTIGVGLGWATATITPEWAVTALVGLIGTVFALRLLLQRGMVEPRKAEVAPGVFWGTLTGFTSFVNHSGGPPYQIYVLPLGLSKMVYAATSTVLFAYLNVIKLVPYWALGQFNPGNLTVSALLMPLAAISVFAGVKLVKIIPERLFFQIVNWALLAISLKLIWDGLSAAS